MSKQITPDELSCLVTGLLTRPWLLNSFDTAEQHEAFMADIGRVVADHCGGLVNGVNPPDTRENYLYTEESSPTLSVSPDECLPSLHNNVWSVFDPEGWEDEDASAYGIDPGTPLSKEVARNLCTVLRSLLPQIMLAQGASPSFAFEMVDWRVADGALPSDHDEAKPWKVEVELGQTPLLTLSDPQGEEACTVLLEVEGTAPRVLVYQPGYEEPRLLFSGRGKEATLSLQDSDVKVRG